MHPWRLHHSYSRPSSIAEAVKTLESAGGDGKVLAGGQSLVQVLAMRLGRVNLPDGFDEIDAEVLENSRFFPCPADWAS
ncbi:carbon-monoxide dehydrogenase medium subunit [Rhodococcus percolatus]|nr:carbon-monoxide dehydrogenase medium subunit [Rhodococcus opacus]MBP2207292.1 carbon-monoxide dehydrogenase medium subunit [Rhodococcus opacus]